MKIFRFALFLLFIGVGVFGYKGLGKKSEVAAFPRGREKPMQVEAIRLAAESFRPTISSRGFVTSAQRGMLKPEVAGVVASIADNFDTGFSFERGDILLELRKSDFEAAVASARAEIGRLEADSGEGSARCGALILARGEWHALSAIAPGGARAADPAG